MKIYILLLLLTLTLLNASESQKTIVDVSCFEKEKFYLKISHTELYLSDDAVIDNLGGYVDVPEDRYYLKTNETIYTLDGLVEFSTKKNLNQFSTIIDKKELDNIKKSENITFIQKIVLESENKISTQKTKTATNILNVYFDLNAIEEEYQKCKLEIVQKEENSYIEILLSIISIFIVGLFFLKRKTTK
ncbi:MAG: hypothetical protein U9P38_01740 [Campylobacterota bacterium]|nr:hypothetical protein [Campylobacterota bacterium]